jgi:myo-inositol-1(or 4)-monophosphatase
MANTELELAKKAAIEGGKVLMKYYGKVSMNYKKDRSIATEADLVSERRIKKIIEEAFPNHSILGEEYGLEERYSDYKWIIDPLDGTTNYWIKNPFFCVSIALTQREEPIIGVVYYPITEEMFYAQKGEGAYMNDSQISLSDTSEIADSIVTFCHGRDKTSIREMIQIFGKLKPITSKVRQIGATALELCYVACGRTDAFYVVGSNPWDVIAGITIVKESGGKVSDFEGNPYKIKTKNLIASNCRLHQKLLNLIHHPE